MFLEAAEKFDGMYKNRYEAVLLVAKHARKLNQQRLRDESEEEEETTSGDRQSKIIVQAIKDAMDGDVEFERIEKA
jgi:DNA-directed RNA polymerase subunit K/omega